MNRIVSARSLAVLVLVAAAAAQPPAPAITQLFDFPCDQTLANCPQGDSPQVLIEGADGNFYGITTAGGTGLNGCAPPTHRTARCPLGSRGRWAQHSATVRKSKSMEKRRETALH